MLTPKTSDSSRRISMEHPRLPRSILFICSWPIFSRRASSYWVSPILLRSSLILCPNSIWLKYMSHPFRKRGRMDFHLRTKRLEQAVFPQCRANEKAPSKSNPWSGYGYPLTNRSGFVRRLVVFTVPEGILLRLLDLKSICVIQLLCISVFPGCIHISGIVLPCLAMISSSVWGS